MSAASFERPAVGVVAAPVPLLWRWWLEQIRQCEAKRLGAVLCRYLLLPPSGVNFRSSVACDKARINPSRNDNCVALGDLRRHCRETPSRRARPRGPSRASQTGPTDRRPTAAHPRSSQTTHSSSSDGWSRSSGGFYELPEISQRAIDSQPVYLPACSQHRDVFHSRGWLRSVNANQVDVRQVLPRFRFEKCCGRIRERLHSLDRHAGTARGPGTGDSPLDCASAISSRK